MLFGVLLIDGNLELYIHTNFLFSFEALIRGIFRWLGVQKQSEIHICEGELTKWNQLFKSLSDLNKVSSNKRNVRKDGNKF